MHSVSKNHNNCKGVHKYFRGCPKHYVHLFTNFVQGVQKYCLGCPEILFRVSRIIVQGVPKYCSEYLQILLRVIQVAHKYVHYMYRVTTNFHRISTNIVEGVFKYCTCRGFSQIFYKSYPIFFKLSIDIVLCVNNSRINV